jgi:BlaI family transcriptional regulator, penicillinase repressor
MPRPPSRTLTDAEHRIMEVIWRRGAATVAEVTQDLNDTLAYTTVLTVMRILRAKGYLIGRKSGRAHVYSPKVDRDAAAKKAVRQLLTKFFAGSPSDLVLSFLRDEEFTPDELEKLKKKIEESAKDEP